MRRNGMLLWKQATPYFLLLPALIAMFGIVIYPIINAVKMSFTDYILWKPQDVKFIGFGNYVQLLQDENFLMSLKNTGIWVFFCLLFQFVIGFVVALVLNQDFRGRALSRTIILIPWVTPTVLITLMFRWMYDGNYGVLNDIFYKLGLISQYKAFLSLAETALSAVIAVKVWQGIPFFAIMILAALQTIPKEMYEAAHVDGASKIETFWTITLPYVLPTILITTLLRTIWIANDVDLVYMMTGGGPGNSSMILSVYTYQLAQKSLNFGMASAAAILMTLILVILVMVFLKKIRQAEGKFE